MKPRDIIGKNLRALMAARPDLDTLPKVTEASGVSNGTLDRMRRAVVSARIDDIGRVAAAFGLEAWQLLVPDLVPEMKPSLYKPSAAEIALYKRVERQLERLGDRGSASTRPGDLPR